MCLPLGYHAFRLVADAVRREQDRDKKEREERRQHSIRPFCEQTPPPEGDRADPGQDERREWTVAHRDVSQVRPTERTLRIGPPLDTIASALSGGLQPLHPR